MPTRRERTPTKNKFHVTKDLTRRVSLACLRLKLTRWGSSSTEPLTPKSMFASVDRTSAETILGALDEACSYVDTLLQRTRPPSTKPMEDRLRVVRMELHRDCKQPEPVFSRDHSRILWAALDEPHRSSRQAATTNALAGMLSKSMTSCDHAVTITRRRQTKASGEVLLRKCTPRPDDDLEVFATCLGTPHGIDFKPTPRTQRSNRKRRKTSQSSGSKTGTPDTRRQRRHALRPPPMTPDEIKLALGDREAQARERRRNRSACSKRWGAELAPPTPPLAPALAPTVPVADDVTPFEKTRRSIFNSLRRRAQSSG